MNAYKYKCSKKKSHLKGSSIRIIKQIESVFVCLREAEIYNMNRARDECLTMFVYNKDIESIQQGH